MRTSIAEAKRQIGIREVWSHANIGWEIAPSCRCPLHPDNNASLSVDEGKGLWHCHAGCGGGDQLTLFTRLGGLSRREGVLGFLRLAGEGDGHTHRSLPSAATTKAEDDARKQLKREAWPSFFDLSDRDIERLARLRRISPDAVRFAQEAGILKRTVWCGHASWVIRSEDGRSAQVRRFDGSKWSRPNGDPVKALTLPGSVASTPIGCIAFKPQRTWLLVEGGPDMLAGVHFILQAGRQDDIGVVGILGAGNRIPEAFLKLFQDRRVRIYQHSDQSGVKATHRWANQLRGVAAKIDAVSFVGLHQTSGEPVGDLNDACDIEPTQLNEIVDLLPPHENL